MLLYWYPTRDPMSPPSLVLALLCSLVCTTLGSDFGVREGNVVLEQDAGVSSTELARSIATLKTEFSHELAVMTARITALEGETATAGSTAAHVHITAHARGHARALQVVHHLDIELTDKQSGSRGNDAA